MFSHKPQCDDMIIGDGQSEMKLDRIGAAEDEGGEENVSKMEREREKLCRK